MKHKSAASIQADIRLMRLAYQEREARHENLNRYLGTAHPVTIAAPYILSGCVVLLAIVFILTIAFS